MHYHIIEDEAHEMIDIVPLCSDSCHRQWCEKTGLPYEGWNGAHEGADYPEYCACCGVIAGTGSESDACDCLRDNVVVNRFLSKTGEKCQHGAWIQLPESMLPNRSNPNQFDSEN
jgi:hypothetical protein